jgi:hypothetical protein
MLTASATRAIPRSEFPIAIGVAMVRGLAIIGMVSGTTAVLDGETSNVLPFFPITLLQPMAPITNAPAILKESI